MTATPRIRDRFFDATPQIFTSRLAHYYVVALSANVAINKVPTTTTPPPIKYSTMSDPKVALITGITGQDGSYLTELLLEKGYIVSLSFVLAARPPIGGFTLNASDGSLGLQ